MMKIFAILTVVMACASAASGAVVPQKSQHDYYFSTPYATNSVRQTNLHGIVIGEPPDYRILRREDVAWLREAACERAALARRGRWWTSSERSTWPVFGHFPLSQTNEFSSYTIAHEWRNGHMETNIVVGWYWVTNSPGHGIDEPNPRRYPGVDVFSDIGFGTGSDRYLSSSNDLASGRQNFKGWPPDHTNIVVTVVTNWGGISWEDDDIIFHRTQCVTTVTMPMTNGTTSVRKNSWSVALPWEEKRTETNITAGSSFDLLFVGKEAKWDDTPPPSPMSPFPSYSYITNCYDFLRGKKFLVDSVSNTNLNRSIVHRWRYDYDDDDWHMTPETFTNMTASVGYFVSGNVIDLIAEGYEAGNGRLVFPTRFDWDVVHTGGVRRIKSATLYADVSVLYDPYGDMPVVYGRSVTKLGTAEMVREPQGGKVCFEAYVDGPDVARAGASAVGAPVRPGWKDWHYDVASYSVSFFLVYELAPWASLPGWND